jgi:hypothetical protein
VYTISPSSTIGVASISWNAFGTTVERVCGGSGKADAAGGFWGLSSFNN